MKSIMLLNFNFHVPKSLPTNLFKNDPVVSEKNKFIFSYVHVNYLGPRTRNDLYLKYPYTFICSICCLHLPTVRSQATGHRPQVNQRSTFEQTMMEWSPQCYIPSFVVISQLVPEKKIFEGFLPYMNMAAILVIQPASYYKIVISMTHVLKS